MATVIGFSGGIDAASFSVAAQATTAAFVEVLKAQNDRGLTGVGTIKNTGGVNALNVRETVTDKFGTTATVTTLVAAGVFKRLDLAPAVDIGAARVPYISYTVEVNHPVAVTTFDLQLVAQGASRANP